MAAQQTEIKTRVTPHFTLILDGEDGSPARTWRLCPTYKSLAKIEEAYRSRSEEGRFVAEDFIRQGLPEDRSRPAGKVQSRGDAG